MARDGTDQLTLDEAYQAAFLWFDHKGEPPLEITEPSHGSVQIVTETTAARIRWATRPIDQRSVLAFLGSAPEQKRLAIFSASGYSAGALAVAESQGMALYAFDSSGVAHPMTTHARSLAPDIEPDPPFAPVEIEAEEEDFWTSNLKREDVPEEDPVPDSATPHVVNPDDWRDCPTCTTTHFKTAKYCRECGTDLISGASHSGGAESISASLRCRTCGGSDIAVD